MDDMDFEFLKEYKRLNKICGEILNCDNGVSEYINEMERTDNISFKVPSWSDDLKTLKHLRYIRNQIVHDDFDIGFSTEDDVEQVHTFYNRIYNMDDPFARFRKVSSANSVTSKSGSQAKDVKSSNNITFNYKHTPQQYVYMGKPVEFKSRLKKNSFLKSLSLSLRILGLLICFSIVLVLIVYLVTNG